jgi:hypothetical protein
VKISLAQQIEEVEAELGQRAGVYQRLVVAGKMRESVAEYKTNRMKAVRETLLWLADNEEAVRAFVAAKRRGQG